MLIAAAVCPHPPLLIPAVTGTGTDEGHPVAAELTRLRAACDAAVDAVCGAGPQIVVAVGAVGPTLRDFGVPSDIGVGPPTLSLPQIIARWLIRRWLTARDGQWAGVQPTLLLQGVAADATPAECLRLGAELAGLKPRVAMLVMGDGPGCRARGIEGAADPAADRYDAQVTHAFASADPAALAALDPAEADDLFAVGRAPWQVLAGAAQGAAYQARLHYAAAPFEVSYYVASWRRPSEAEAAD